ncbi:Central kinetochore-associated [Penicillium chermesinum]|nr:Central kinetochore-associated [Penicillium chermesinum]
MSFEKPAPSSPLKQAWKDLQFSPSAPSVDENHISHDQHDVDDMHHDNIFQEPASSPFQYDAREDTVDFQKLRELQQGLPGSPRRLEYDIAEEPLSSPFRTETKDDPVDIPKLREVPPLSSPIKKSTPVIDPESSPFRPEAKDETVDFENLQDLQHESVDCDEELLDQPSSPVQPHQGEQELEPLKGHEFQRHSLGRVKRSPVSHRSSMARDGDVESTLDVQKVRTARSSGTDERRSSIKSRKRSYDHFPEDYDDDMEANERCKKGTRSERPVIPVDAEESSVIHNQSLLSMASASQDPSTIANSAMEDRRNEGMSTVLQDDEDMPQPDFANEDDHDPMDDTGLSNFSVLPDLTSFAKLRAESPMKSMRGSVGPGPASDRHGFEPATPGTARRSWRASTLLDTGSNAGTPTPRRRVSRDIGNPNETPNLLDFTDHSSFFRNSVQQARMSMSQRRSPMRNMRQSMRSPSKLSLLDFDIPPAPTPRSIPTVTPRELESLKSGFMSEISSLKAALSGKEAEVASYRQAVADAERRVGEALEEARNEAAQKEALEIEQAEWDRRGKDMERVLQSVRDELEEGERERDRLTRRADDAEKSKEQLEGKVVELETQLSAARSSTSVEAGSAMNVKQNTPSAEETAREVQDAVEKVARELHTLYKSKHETKVAALKKSYESRWEKRLREVENKLTAAREENRRLKADQKAANSESIAMANASMIARENDEHEAEKRVFEAQLKGLQQEMATIKEDAERLRSALKSERAEKGELVAAVDEWLAMQQGQPAPAQPPAQRQPSGSSAGTPDDEHQSASEAVPAEPLRRSVSRSGSSGIRPPATAEKKISRFGGPGGHSRGNSGGRSGIAIPTPGRGGIMSSIERMGRGGA